MPSHTKPQVLSAPDPKVLKMPGPWYVSQRKMEVSISGPRQRLCVQHVDCWGPDTGPTAPGSEHHLSGFGLSWQAPRFGLIFLPMLSFFSILACALAY